MKKRWVILTLFFFLAVPTFVFAHGHEGRKERNEGREGGFSLEDKYFGKVHFLFENKDALGLTEDQMEQIIIPYL